MKRFFERFARAGLVFTLLAVSLAGAADAETRRRALPDPGMAAALTNDGEIFLEAVPVPSEGLLAFSRRLTGSNDAAATISELAGKPRRLLAGVRYRVPFDLLLPELQVQVIQALFPDDVARADGWLHKAPAGGEENLWRVGEWFTGSGQSFKVLREANQLEDNAVPPGESLLIPAGLLRPALRAALPPAESPYGLEYGRDAKGGYAVYRLKKGEALYSAVVVRFTGRVHAEYVNALAADLAELNKIADVTDMPVGQAIRIPFDLLLPEFLPPGDPGRQEWERNRTASDQVSNPVRTTRLEGITVILDAGHGGQDPGTMKGGVREAVYVYDIMLRTKAALERRTAAKVLPTVRDGSDFEIPDRDVLPVSSDHRVLTSPPYSIVDASVATNLRWYLANSMHKKAVRQSGEDAKTVFLSFHADSLHPSLRGAMAYIPAVSLTKGAYGKSGSVYEARAEVKESPQVDFTWKERVRSEGLSRELAALIMKSFRRHGLVVHSEEEIRDRIIRSRHSRPFVPAVIRRNAVPAKLLLEVCNLNNDEDRRLLQTRAFRQQVADAVTDGILAYYGQTAEPGTAVAAR